MRNLSKPCSCLLCSSHCVRLALLGRRVESSAECLAPMHPSFWVLGRLLLSRRLPAVPLFRCRLSRPHALWGPQGQHAAGPCVYSPRCVATLSSRWSVRSSHRRIWRLASVCFSSGRRLRMGHSAPHHFYLQVLECVAIGVRLILDADVTSAHPLIGYAMMPPARRIVFCKSSPIRGLVAIFGWPPPTGRTPTAAAEAAETDFRHQSRPA